MLIITAPQRQRQEDNSIHYQQLTYVRHCLDLKRKGMVGCLSAQCFPGPCENLNYTPNMLLETRCLVACMPFSLTAGDMEAGDCPGLTQHLATGWILAQ